VWKERVNPDDEEYRKGLALNAEANMASRRRWRTGGTWAKTTTTTAEATATMMTRTRSKRR